MAFSLRCPDCREKFPWEANTKFPDYCPRCSSYIGSGDDDVVAAPFLSSKKNRSMDDVYRAMERGAEFRAQKAAHDLGVPVSEMSGLKITDMKDNAREGEASNIEVPQNNEVAKAMAQSPGGLGFVGSPGATFSQGVQSGPGANSGIRAIQTVRSGHNRYVPQGMSEMPAKEITDNPGYRPRA